MANSILNKRSSVTGKVPATGDLEYGELAINYADGVLYYKKSNNTISSILPVIPGATTSGVSYITAGNALTTSSGFTFNSTSGNLTATGFIGAHYGSGNFTSVTTDNGFFWSNGSPYVPPAGPAISADRLTTARTITLSGDTTGSVSFDGSQNVTITTVITDDSHNHVISNVDGLQTALDTKLVSSDIANFETTTQLNTRDTNNRARGNHTGAQAISTVTGLQTALDGKLGTGDNAVTASNWITARTITLSGDTTGSVSIDGSANVTMSVTVVDNSHDHVIGNVAGLQSALDSKLASSVYTAADVLTKIKTVDGASSGLDADLLDGQHGSYYLDWTNATNKPDPVITLTGAVTGTGTMTDLGSVSIATTATSDPVLTLAGDVTGTTTFTNLGNATLTAVVGDNTHNHSIDTISDEHRLFNNMGETHSTRTSFDAITPSYNFGWRFVQGATNGPGTGTNYYSLYAGLGNDYAATGAGSYGMQLAIPRNTTTPYLSIRYNENNSLAAWQKISAGYADTAGLANAVAWANVSDKPDPVITLSGAVTGTGTMTDLGSVSITTTATSDPVLTLTGDVTGTATFTNLGNATLTATVSDDSHNHIISNVDGLQTILDAKAPLESPALSGTPTAPTAIAATNTTQVATTAFVQTAVANLVDSSPGALDTLNELAAALGDDPNFATTVSTQIGWKSNIASPTFTGIPGAPTAAVGTNTTQLATTAFVNAEIANDAPTKTGTGASGTWGISITGNAATATKWATARTITLGGVLSGSVSIDGSSNATLTADHTSDPVITLSGAVTGTGTMTNLGSVTIATTATSDPVLTLSGDVTGTATFTNLGNATLTATVADDSHNHSASTLTGVLPSAGGTLTGILNVSSTGNIVWADTGGTYIPRPQGGTYKTTASVLTGALSILMPTTAGVTVNDMLSFWVDVYDYASGNEGESVSIYIYGYLTGARSWANCGATVFSDRTDRDYTVRFGENGAVPVVCIGEVGTVWSYPQIIVRDFQAGYDATGATYDDGWSITFLTTLPTISQTSTANYPVAKSASTLTTARTIGGVSFDGSANINLPGVNTAGNQNTTGSAATLTTARAINGVNFNGSAAITVEPYVERDDTTNAARYLTFVDDATAAHKRLNMDVNLSFNPSTNVLSTTATSAQYADLAEKYTSDSDYAPGTVVIFGGIAEVTISNNSHDTAVAGIVSTNPAYLMNNDEIGVAVALTGKVPCQVMGPVRKGTVLVTGHLPGVAQALDLEKFVPGCILGKAMESIDHEAVQTINVAVGRF